MTAMTELSKAFAWIFKTSWQAAVIALILLIVQFLLRNRLSPSWRHGLWFLLVARLLIPMTPGSAISIFNFAKWTRQYTPRATVALLPPSRPALAVSAPVSGPVASEVTSLPASPPRPLEAGTNLPSAKVARPANWMRLAALIWLAGALILTVRFVWLDNRFRHRLAGVAPTTDDPLSGLVKECARALRVSQRLDVLETDEVESPAVYGLWRKRLLLPTGLCNLLSSEELRHVLLHELAHIKRRDPEWNWLLAFLHIAHWFNPVLWLAFARFRIDRELATDDLALAHTSESNRAFYGETILKLLEGLTRRQAVAGLVGIAESGSQIKERIHAIAHGGGSRWRWAACLVALVIGGVTLTNAIEDAPDKGIDLLKRYPTTLTAGDAVPANARPWQFAPEDIFQISNFTFNVGKLRVETGVADLGIGHCADGAVWAVLIPREGGKLTSPVATNQESIAHVWLRFHPTEIRTIFAAATVSASGRVGLENRMRAIAEMKMNSSWQAGGQAMIPNPKDMTVDVDTQEGPRRFFVVDKTAQTAEYVPFFAARGLRQTTQLTYEPELDTNCARVVSVAPADGAKDVESVQELRIRFDRAMDPHHLKLEWLTGGFQLDGGIKIANDQEEFVIPVRLTPGEEQQLVLNRDDDREMRLATGGHADQKPPHRNLRGGGFIDTNTVPANEFRWSFSTKLATLKPDAPTPRVVSVSPPSGATAPVLTFVEVTFDQPMRPPDALLPYLPKRIFGGPELIPSVDYDPDSRRFTFPVILPVDDDARLTLRGFYSADGVASDPLILHYQTSDETIDPKYTARAKNAAHDRNLQQLLTSMKEARSGLNSGVEVVQTFRLGMNSKTAFSSIDANTATFKWQGADQVYADITGPMGMAIKSFILGCDGKTCWLYSEDGDGKKRLEVTPADVTQRSMVMLDPFGLAAQSVQDVLNQRQLVSDSDAMLDGRNCHRVESWEVSASGIIFATRTVWWIDAKSFLPAQILQYYPGGATITHYACEDLGQPLADIVFQAPVAPGAGARPLFFEKAPAPDEQRFFHISDGSNGRMSGRIGWNGPNGSTDSGVN